MAITRGVDVSWWQGAVDWAAVARDGTPYRYGICRMARAGGGIDDTGRRNLRGELDHLPIAGGYGVVGTRDPVGDAKVFMDEIAAVTDPHRVIVMLDAERFTDGTGPSRRQINAFAGQVHAELGRWPLAYVPDWYLDWLATKGDGDGTVRGLDLANCPWAPSEYFGAPWTEDRLRARKPTNLRGFTSLGHLQYTSSATVAGISGRVDANCFYGTLDELRRQLLGGQEVPDVTDDQAKQLKFIYDVLNDQLGDGTPIDHETKLYRLLAWGTETKGDGRPNLADLAAAIVELKAAVDALKAGVPVTLTDAQLASIKASLQTLEGSALVQLAVSPAP